MFGIWNVANISSLIVGEVIRGISLFIKCCRIISVTNLMSGFLVVRLAALLVKCTMLTRRCNSFTCQLVER